MKNGRQSLSVWDEPIPLHTSAKKHVNKLGKFSGSEDKSCTAKRACVLVSRVWGLGDAVKHVCESGS